ncbi:1911_t:CDS:2 [Cetraspora pellucida]|uniref:1911_t:CDS:1 n=1 Tax=Cetraspora pellucida TaxID=1433469 RepID=A0ACA9KWT1_9GLOM|nr:1911_t:CDS:2 [Cetraspora pellucida]
MARLKSKANKVKESSITSASEANYGQVGLNGATREHAMKKLPEVTSPKRMKKNKKNKKSKTTPVIGLSDDFVHMYNNLVDKLQSPNENERNKSIEVLADLVATKHIIEPTMFLKLWICLIECLKMSTVADMPYTISNLMAVINDLNLNPFIKSFWKVVEREWNNVDSHRSFVRAFLTRISRDSGSKSSIHSLTILESSLSSKTPDGVKYHLCDVYVDELAFVGTSVKWNIPMAQLLRPFQSLLVKSQNKHLINKISENVLEKILTVIPIGEGARHIRLELTKIVNKMIQIINDDNMSAICRNQAKIIAQKYLQTITEITDKLSDNVAEEMDEISKSDSEAPNLLKDISKINRSSKSISWGVNVTREYVKDSTVPANTLVTPSIPPRSILKRRHDFEEGADYEIHRMTNLTLSKPAKKFREDKNKC